MSIFLEDGKLYISVIHFSVIAFVQANLTLSSCFTHLDKTNSWKFFNSFALNYFDFWKVSSIGLQVCEREQAGSLCYPDFALNAQNDHQMGFSKYKENRGVALYVQN